MDPYLQITENTAYPAALVTTGMNDPRVSAWQPAKFAARLQEASSSGNPVLSLPMLTPAMEWEIRNQKNSRRWPMCSVSVSGRPAILISSQRNNSETVSLPAQMNSASSDQRAISPSSLFCSACSSSPRRCTTVKSLPAAASSADMAPCRSSARAIACSSRSSSFFPYR